MLIKELSLEIKAICSDLKSPTYRCILLITAVLLVLEYFGWQGPFHRIFAPALKKTASWNELKLLAQAYTTLSFWLLFIIVPTIVLKVFKIQTKLEGLSFPSFKEWRPYLVFAMIMLIILSVVCSSPSFYQFYPLYRPQGFLDWFKFELIYLPQFIAVEFFFRGPLLFFFHKELQRLSLILMTLPYAIIHIHKPFPEAIASIFAGIILGHFALKSKSIWPGVFLHMAVALGADFFGLFYSNTMGRW